MNSPLSSNIGVVLPSALSFSIAVASAASASSLVSENCLSQSYFVNFFSRKRLALQEAGKLIKLSGER